MLRALVLSVVLAGASLASAGAAPRPKLIDVLQGVEARPLQAVGDDAIRFSSTPSLGGRGYVIEVHRTRNGSAVGSAVAVNGHPRAGWRRTGAATIRLSRSEYATLAAEVDRLLQRGDPGFQSGPGWVMVCADGPGWLTERRRDGLTQRLAGFCGDHPNEGIAKLMTQLVPSLDLPAS